MKHKTSKKLLLAITLIGAFFGTHLYAQNFLPVGTLGAVNSCSTNSKMYLNEHNYTGGLWDYYLYLRSNFRLTMDNPPSYNAGQILQYEDSTNPNNTSVFYYTAEPEMLKKRDPTNSGYYPLDNITFKRASWVFPYNQRVRGIDTNNTRIIFIQPTLSTGNNIVSVVYRYKYTYATGNLNGTSPYRYNTVASGLDYHGLNAYDYVDWTSTKRQRYATALPVEYCKNYELHRCGDGQLNTYDTSFLNQFTGEVCDDGNNVDGDGCNATCSGTGGGVPMCGDNIINDGSTEAGHGPTYFSGGVEMIEQCDDGPWDENVEPPVGNHDGYQFATCASYCEKNTEPEQLPEELGQ